MLAAFERLAFFWCLSLARRFTGVCRAGRMAAVADGETSVAVLSGGCVGGVTAGGIDGHGT
jgi:hypothetical protein